MINASGAVSGRITRTEYVFSNGTSEQKTKKLRVGGKVMRVKATTHAGYKVLIAKIKVTLSDGQTGVLTVYYPYTVAKAGRSGQGAIEDRGFAGNMQFQEKP